MHGDRILQMIEGREKAVRELYAKIELDSRHTITKMVSAAEDEERFLMNWSMVVRDITRIPTDLFEEYEKIFDAMQQSEKHTDITIDHFELFKALSLLGALPL